MICRGSFHIPYDVALSLWRISHFDSRYYFTIRNNSYIHFLVIPNYFVGSSAAEKLKSTVPFLLNNSGIVLRLPTGESRDEVFLFSKFLIEVLYRSKATVLCCRRIVTFRSNLALNIVSTACNDLFFTFYFGRHFESGI